MSPEASPAPIILLDVRNLPDSKPIGWAARLACLAIATLFLASFCFVLWAQWRFQIWQGGGWLIESFLLLTVPLLAFSAVNDWRGERDRLLEHRGWLDSGKHEICEGRITKHDRTFIRSRTAFGGLYESFEVDGTRFTLRGQPHGEWFTRGMVGTKVRISHRDGIFLRVEAWGVPGSGEGSVP